jgi:hypothetical protein
MEENNNTVVLESCPHCSGTHSITYDLTKALDRALHSEDGSAVCMGICPATKKSAYLRVYPLAAERDQEFRSMVKSFHSGTGTAKGEAIAISPVVR